MGGRIMTLYEITSEMRALDELFLSCIDEETGEVKDDGVIDILEQELQIQLQTKGAGIIKSFKNSETMLNGVDEEIAREALRLAMHKLPLKCKVVSKADLEGGAE